MGNCADACLNKKDAPEVQEPPKKKDANYIVGANNGNFDVTNYMI